MNQIVKQVAFLEAERLAMGKTSEVTQKSLPSQPIWYSLQSDYGFWDGDRSQLLKLMAFYQKNAIVHGAIDINAKGIAAACPTLMKMVNKGAKNLQTRGLKRLAQKRLKQLRRQWAEPALSRKSMADDEELVEVDSHPMLDALHSADQDQTFHSLLRLAVINLCIYGIAFIAKIRDTMGRVTSYRYLPTYNVSPNRAEDGRVSGWFYSSSYGDSFDLKEPIDKEDMLVIRWPSLTDPHAGGDSPLMSAIRKLEASGKWSDLQDWIVSNKARPDWYFIPKEGVSPANAERQEKQLNDKYRGPGNGRIGIAEQAGTIVPLNWSPTDLAPLKFDDALKDAILFALSIPEAFFNNESNRATMDASLEQWARQSLAPIVSLLESSLNAEARTYGDDSYIWVFENVIPADRTQELAEETFELSKWVAALTAPTPVVTPDEFRQHVLGLTEPMPEAEPEPTPPAPIIVQTINDAIQDQPEDEDIEEAEETADDQPAKGLDLLALNTKVAAGKIDRATAINLVSHVLRLPQEQAKALVTHPVTRKTTKARKALPQVKLLGHVTQMLADTITRQMDRQKSHYMNQLHGNHPKGLGSADLHAKALDLPDKFLPLDEWDEEDASLYKPYLHMQGTATADARIDAFVGVGAEQDRFSVVPENVDKAVAKSTLKFAKSTNDTTATNINDALKQLRSDIESGVVDGDPIPLMRKKVEAVFEDISNDRAELIARTEVSRAAHEAQRITAKASGIVKGFKLLASSECCDQCDEINGKEIGMDDKFNGDDDYDDSMLPIHPNCRCTTQEIIDFDKLGEDD